jgi:ribose 5-phosphate isomerase B
MKVIIGSDHAGYALKERLKNYFDKVNIKYEDVGAFSKNDKDDYPVYAEMVSKKVSKNKLLKGILICGSGTGMAIAANKFRGIRAVVCYDKYSAKMSRHDNDANVLCLRGRFFPHDKARDIVSVWLKSKFSGLARHKRRVSELKKLERK